MNTLLNPFLFIVIALAALLAGAVLGFLVAQLRAARQIEAVRIELEGGACSAGIHDPAGG